MILRSYYSSAQPSLYVINGLPSLETCRVKHTADVVYLLPGTIKYQTPLILQMYGNELPGRRVNSRHASPGEWLSLIDDLDIINSARKIVESTFVTVV